MVSAWTSTGTLRLWTPSNTDSSGTLTIGVVYYEFMQVQICSNNSQGNGLPGIYISQYHDNEQRPKKTNCSSNNSTIRNSTSIVVFNLNNLQNAAAPDVLDVWF